MRSATSYTLEEDDDNSFSSPTTMYSGSDTSTFISDRGLGVYFYRVKASNTSGSSSWSNAVSVQVTRTEIVPQPGTWRARSGSLTISFIVSSDSKSVSNCRMQASCGSKSIAGPVAIENSSFVLVHSDSINFIAATFDEVNRAHGSYGFWKNSSCWAIGTVIFSH